MADLSFLRDSVSVYYAGLDYRAFPFTETNSRIDADQSMHIIYLKVLALLVDHVAIPPAFLVSGMLPNDRNEIFLRSLSDLFQTKTFVTAVHGTMNDPLDFFWYKLETGDKEEKQIFKRRLREARSFFREIPLLHRDIPSMSGNFKDLLLINIDNLPNSTLSVELKEKLRLRVGQSEAYGEVALSRMSFIDILDKLVLTRHQYRACYYAMNSAYYLSGARTYYSDISCLSVEEFSVLGPERFRPSDNRIVVGYDPSLFYRVLRCHGITISDIQALNPIEIDGLKRDSRFISFVSLYRDFVNVLQSAQNIVEYWPKSRIAEFKEDLLCEIEARFHAEQKRLAKWVFGEDVGSGFFTAILGAVLGFAIAGPPGAIAGAGVGFFGPLLKMGKFSAAEVIANKVSQKQFSFFLYVEYLREKIDKLKRNSEYSEKP